MYEMTPCKFIYSIIITTLVLFGLQIPTHWLYLIFLAIGLVGIISQHSARLFLYLVMAYTLFIVFYAPLITLSASLAPQFQPKVISILIITLALSLLGRIFLYADRAETIERRGLKLILLAALITVFFQINKVLPYSSIAVFLAVATISYGTINIKIFSTTYDYKKRHIAIALMIFILLPFLNLIQLDNSKRTIGFIKYHSVWAKENFPYTTADWTLKSNYSYSEFSKIIILPKNWTGE